MTTTSISKVDQIVNSLNKTWKPGEVREVRAPKCGRNGTVAGYFDHDNIHKLAGDILQYNKQAEGLYVTINPVLPEALSRIHNRLKARADNLTADKEILKRTVFAIDIDPVRIKAISSTDSEHEAALQAGLKVKAYLENDLGWPAGIRGSSGNGCHLQYLIDLPNDDVSRDLLKNCLAALAHLFNTKTIDIDQTVFNASRILKLPRTYAAKGDNTPDRPWREAHYIDVPDGDLQVVSIEQLERLSALVPLPDEDVQQQRQSSSYTGGISFELEPWMEKHGIKVARSTSWNGGTMFVLEECPLDSQHKNSRIIKFQNGAISFGCFHNSCSSYKWQDLRNLKEPGCYNKKSDTKSSNGSKANSTGTKTASIVRLSDVAPEDVIFVWKPFLPRRKLTLFEGDPGIGKTYLALLFSTIITLGAPWPNPKTGKVDVPGEAGNVLYMTAEDGLADTLRPRLDAMGADVTRFFALTGSTNEDGKLNGVTLSDVDVIEQALKQVRPEMMVIDPLQGYLGAGVDMHRANEVRPILTGLAQLAEKYNTAVLCIRHLTKGSTNRNMYRGIGSIDFTAAARSVIMAGQDPNDPNKRAICHLKSSLAETGPSIGYEIKDGGFYWTGLSDLTADQMLSGRPEETEGKSAIDEAAEFITETLADGPVHAEGIIKTAKKSGIAERTLMRAKKDIGVISKKEEGKGGAWNWHLPDEQKTKKPSSQEEGFTEEEF